MLPSSSFPAGSNGSCHRWSSRRDWPSEQELQGCSPLRSTLTCADHGGMANVVRHLEVVCPACRILGIQRDSLVPVCKSPQSGNCGCVVACIPQESLVPQLGHSSPNDVFRCVLVLQPKQKLRSPSNPLTLTKPRHSWPALTQGSMFCAGGSR